MLTPDIVTMPAAYYVAPLLAMMGLVCLATPKHILSLKKEWISSKSMMFLGGILGFLGGMAMLDSTAMSWDNWINIVVNVIGWGLILKSSIMMCLPQILEKTSNAIGNDYYQKIIPAVGLVYLLLGLGMQISLLMYG